MKQAKNVLIMADYRTQNSGNFVASIVEFAKRIQANGGKTVYIAPDTPPGIHGRSGSKTLMLK